MFHCGILSQQMSSAASSSAFSRESSGIMDRAMTRPVPRPLPRRVIVPRLHQAPAVYNRGWCFRNCEHWSSKYGQCMVHAPGTKSNPIDLDVDE